MRYGSSIRFSVRPPALISNTPSEVILTPESAKNATQHKGKQGEGDRVGEVTKMEGQPRKIEREKEGKRRDAGQWRGRRRGVRGDTEQERCKEVERREGEAGRDNERKTKGDSFRDQ